MIFELIVVWLLLINLVGFVSMGVDKRRARRRKSRVPERTLFLLATVGGTLGILVGMKAFRHKTQHNSFRYGMPGLLLGQMALAMYISLQKL